MGLNNGLKSQILNCKKNVFCKFSQIIEVQTTNHRYIHFGNLKVCFGGRVGIFLYNNGKADRFRKGWQGIRILDNKLLHGMFEGDD